MGASSFQVVAVLLTSHDLCVAQSVQIERDFVLFFLCTSFKHVGLRLLLTLCRVTLRFCRLTVCTMFYAMLLHSARDKIAGLPLQFATQELPVANYCSSNFE